MKQSEKVLFLSIAVCAILSLVFPRLLAETYYVSPFGNDANLGTESAPWKTLTKAAGVVQPGDTVYVKDGSYSGFEVKKSGATDKYISFIAYPGSTPTVGQIYFREGVGYNKFAGFEIVPLSGGGIIMSGNNDYNMVLMCHIHGTAGSKGSPGIDLGGGCDFNLVEECEIHDFYYAVHTSEAANKGNIFRGNICYNLYDDGFNFSPDTQDTQIVGNTIYNVDLEGDGGADGIHLYDDGSAIVRGNLVYIDGSSTGGVLWIHGGANHIVENNTFVALPGFNASFGGVVCLEYCSNVILKNNIGYSATGSAGILAIFNSTVIEDYNDWYNCQNSSKVIYYKGKWMSLSEYQSYGKGWHSLSVDPKFKNVAPPYDFHLEEGSPCIGSGENGADMGAYGVGPQGEPIPGRRPSPLRDRKVFNFPNPFRAGKESTTISYRLIAPSDVEVIIYDALGQEVWRRNYRAGENGGREENNISWDGRNSQGAIVGNGVYIARIWISNEKKYLVRKIAVAR